MNKYLSILLICILTGISAMAQSDYGINYTRDFKYIGTKYRLTLIKAGHEDYGFRIENPAYKPKAAIINDPLLTKLKGKCAAIADSLTLMLLDDATDSLIWDNKLSSLLDDVKSCYDFAGDDASKLKTLATEDSLRTIRRSSDGGYSRPSKLYDYLKSAGAPKTFLTAIQKQLADTTIANRSTWKDNLLKTINDANKYLGLDSAKIALNLTADSAEYVKQMLQLDTLRQFKRDLDSAFAKFNNNKLLSSLYKPDLMQKQLDDLNLRIAGFASIRDGSSKSTKPDADKVTALTTDTVKQIDFETKGVDYWEFQEQFCDALRKVAGLSESLTIEGIAKDLTLANPENNDTLNHKGDWCLVFIYGQVNSLLNNRDDIHGPNSGRLEITQQRIRVKEFPNKNNYGKPLDLKQLAEKIKYLDSLMKTYKKFFEDTKDVDQLNKDFNALIKPLRKYMLKFGSMATLSGESRKIKRNIRKVDKKIDLIEKAIMFKSTLGLLSTSTRYNTCFLLPALAGGVRPSASDTTVKTGRLNTDTLGQMQSMQLEFKDGNIERIQVLLLYKDTTRIFSNNFPIPFSTERDYKKLNRQFLYTRVWGGSYDSYGICLGDFLQYIPYYRSGRRDFSPANGVLTIDPKKPTNILSKGRLQDIFEVIMYTDFAGLQQDKPNGLIQFDLNKKCPLSTHRYSPKGQGESKINFGFGSYIIPELIISKIEKNNRDYPGSAYTSIINNTLQQTRYITPIDLLNYENTRMNIKLNIVTIDLKQLKSEMFLNTNGSFGLTGYADSTRTIDSGVIKTTGQINVSQLPHFTWNVELGYEYQGDERFGIRVHGLIERPWVTDRNVLIVSNLQRFQENGTVSENHGNNNWMFGLGLKAWIKPGGFMAKQNGTSTNGGSIFFKLAFTQSIYERPQHFYQLQLGYAYNIFAIRSK